MRAMVADAAPHVNPCRRWQAGDSSELMRQCDEWIVAHRHRLLACARLHADEMTDVDLLLSDTLRRVFPVPSELLFPVGLPVNCAERPSLS